MTLSFTAIKHVAEWPPVASATVHKSRGNRERALIAVAAMGNYPPYETSKSLMLSNRKEVRAKTQPPPASTYPILDSMTSHIPAAAQRRQ